MANEFDSKLVINTAEASLGIRNLDKQAQSLDRTLAALDKTTRRADQSLARVAKSVTQIVAAQRIAVQATNKEVDSELKLSRAKAANATARDRNASAALKEARSQQILVTSQQRASSGFQDLSKGASGYARNARSASDATLEIHDSLSNTRYLLYDIGATYRAISIGLLAIPAATATVAAAYERDFAQVLRTTGGISAATVELRSDLKQLATEIPMSFGELANIASIGGQLNIPAAEMADFTDVVARFSSSTNVSIDEAAIAFGRLRDAFPKESEGNAEYFNQIGSAITELGDRSVATETEIIAVVNQLAPLASLAGFTSAEVAGLSSALASVRIRPELARGSFQRIFFDMSAAADEGGEKLNTFARYAGVSADEAKRLIQNNPAPFFSNFIGGIRGAIDQGASFNSVLEDIGLKGVRDRQFLLALANGYDTLAASMALADSSYDKATYLKESSEPVFQTLIANLQKMANAFSNLADTMGTGSLSWLSGIANGLTTIAKAINDLAESSPAFKTVLTGAISLMLIVGVMTAIKAAMAFGLAAIVGFQQVAGKSAIGTSLSFRGLAAQIVVAMRMSRHETSATAAQAVKDFGIIGAAAQLAGFQVEKGTRKITGFKAGMTGLGSSLVGLAGGPIGVAIIAIGALTAAFLGAQAQAKASGEAIANAMAQGAEAGEAAIAAALNEKEMKFLDGSLDAMDDLGKNARQIGEEAGIGFDELILAVQGGDKAVEAFSNRLDEMAKSGEISYTNARFLKTAVGDLATESAGAAEDIEATDAVVEKLGSETLPGATDSLEDTTDAFDEMTKAVDALFGSIFSIVNAESALNAALQSLGEGLAESGSFSTGNEAGRENLANFQAVLEARATLYEQMIGQGEITAEQAAANFETYIAGLMDQMNSMGGDTAAIEQYANDIRDGFHYAISAGVPATIPVQADTSQAQIELDTIKVKYGTIDSDVLVKEHGAKDVAARVDYLTSFIDGETAQPFVAQVDADTDAANENVAATEQFIITALGVPIFTATIDADTHPMIRNVHEATQWAKSALATIANAFIHVHNASARLVGRAGDMALIDVAPAPAAPSGGTIPAPKQRQPTPAPTTKPRQQRASDNPNLSFGDTDFGSAVDGYDKVKDAAAEAADESEKATKKVKDNVKTHAEEVADYAQRIGASLKAAYDQQHGVSSATDAYYSQLNSIKKQREDEIEQVRDLTAKIKELRNARAEDLITARKASIEAGISDKYGEYDRAADYRQQAQTANDAAAEKQRNIDASIKEQNEIRAGIGALTGYSDAAIRNREALRSLESKMNDMIVAYAATGASQQQVSNYAQALTDKFGIQVGQLGYNQTAVNNLIGVTGRYVEAVNAVPYRVATEAENNFPEEVGAARALTDALNDVPSFIKTVHETERRITGHSLVENGNMKDGTKKYLVLNKDGTSTGRQLFNRGGEVGLARGGKVPGRAPSDPRVDNVPALIDGKDPAAIRSGEFIMREQSTNYYGTEFMDAVNRMKLPRYNMGGPVGGRSTSRGGSDGIVAVELSAENLAFLSQLLDREVALYTDSEKIASSANEGNRILASKGIS